MCAELMYSVCSSFGESVRQKEGVGVGVPLRSFEGYISLPEMVWKIVDLGGHCCECLGGSAI